MGGGSCWGFVVSFLFFTFFENFVIERISWCCWRGGGCSVQIHPLDVM